MCPGDARLPLGSRRHTSRECWSCRREAPSAKPERSKEKKGKQRASIERSGWQKVLQRCLWQHAPRRTWREPICVRVRLWAQDSCQCIPVTPKWGTPRQATHRGKERSLQWAALDLYVMLSLLCCRISQVLLCLTYWSSFVLPLGLPEHWLHSADGIPCLLGSGWAESCKRMRCRFSILCPLLSP